MQISLPQKKNGMYVFSRNDFDSVAEMLLQEYAPYMLQKAQPLSVEALADDAYSLTIMDRYLSASGSVLGMINFSDIDVMLVNLDRKFQQEHLMSGTILVDARLLSEHFHRRRRFTIAHELAHWIIHRQMYYQDGPCLNLRQAKQFIACREIGIYQKAGNRLWGTIDWMEWQADHLAASMLMPASIFYSAAQEIMERHHAGSYLLDEIGNKITNKVISELCDLFDVSKTSVRIRLRGRHLLRSVDIYFP